MFPNLSSNVAGPGSRALTAAYVSNFGLIGNYSLHLLYEGVQGNMSWTIGSYATPSSGSTDLQFDWTPVNVVPPVPGETPLRNFSGPVNLDFLTDNDGNLVNLRATYTSYFEDTFLIESSYNPVSNKTDHSM